MKLINTGTGLAIILSSLLVSLNAQDAVKVDGTFTDPRDGKTYNTIQIGEQTWMAGNLAWLPSVSPASSGSDKEPHYYVYGYQGNSVSEAKSTSNFRTYGVLYNWPAAIAACPPGWHLPTDEEWKTLSDYLGGLNKAGGKLKEAGTTFWDVPNKGATNETGFTALPGGYRSYVGTFIHVGYLGYWWTAFKGFSTGAWGRTMYANYSGMSRYYDDRDLGFSVRCLRD